MTNYEKIKGMTAEEMARWILGGVSSKQCDYCSHDSYKCYIRFVCYEPDGVKTLVEWLMADID